MRGNSKIIKKGYMIGLLSVLLMTQACGMKKSDGESESGKQSDTVEEIENKSEEYHDTKKNDQEAADQTEKEEWVMPEVVFEEESDSGYHSQDGNSQSGGGTNSKDESQSGRVSNSKNESQSGTENGSENKNQSGTGDASGNSSQSESTDSSWEKSQTGKEAVPDDAIDSETGQILPDDIF